MTWSEPEEHLRPAAALVALAVLLASCVGGGGTADAPSTTRSDDISAEEKVAAALGGTQAVQDFIIHLDMSAMAGEEVLPILDQVVDQARSGQGESVDLVGGFTFRPVRSLRAMMVDTEGSTLQSLSVDFALLEPTPGQDEQLVRLLTESLGEDPDAGPLLDAMRSSDDHPALVEIVTASHSDRFTHVGPGDASVLDLSFVTTDSGRPEAILSVHLFGQTLPGDPAAEAGLTAQELFAYRWDQGRIQMLGDAGIPLPVSAVAAVDGPASGDLDSSGGRWVIGAMTWDRGWSGLLATDHLNPRLTPSRFARTQSGSLFRRQVVKEALVGEAFLEGFRAGWGLGEVMVEKAKERINPRLTGDDRSVILAVRDPAIPVHCLQARFPEGGSGAAGSGVVVKVGVPVYEGKAGCAFPPDGPGVPAEEYRVVLAFAVAERLCNNVAARLRYQNAIEGPIRWETPGADAITTTGSTFAPNATMPVNPLGGNPPLPGCNRPDRPVRRSGGAVGDVHLVTFDQLFYDNQAAGEFLVFENDVASVQMRTEPWRDSKLASVVTAIAVEVDGRTVSMYIAAPDLVGETWIDGEMVELGRGETVPIGQGALVWTGTGWVVVWPDGTRLTVADSGDRLMFTIYPSDRPATGMLGDGDGDPDNDLVTRDGTPVPGSRLLDPPRFYAEYIDSWRISGDESLFRYGPGESSEGFQIPDFPDHTMIFEDQVDDGAGEEAEAACRAGGLTRPELIASCVYDLLVTGDDTFVYDNFMMQDSLPEPPAPGPADPGVQTADDGDNLFNLGDLDIRFESAPGWCTSDEISLGATRSFTGPEGRQLDLSVQYVDGDEPLATVVLQMEGRVHGWVNTMIVPPSGAIADHTFAAGSLRMTGSAFVNEPFDPELSWNMPLPDGSETAPFELQIRCTP